MYTSNGNLGIPPPQTRLTVRPFPFAFIWYVILAFFYVHGDLALRID